MAAPAPGNAVLFLASEAGLAAERMARRGAFQGPAYRIFVPAALGSRMASPVMAPAEPDAEGDLSLHLPPGQVMCAQIVLDEARRLSKQVRIVDVSHPGDDQALVERFTGEGRVMPVLVRADGRSLEGEESFTPKDVRAFLSGA